MYLVLMAFKKPTFVIQTFTVAEASDHEKVRTEIIFIPNVLETFAAHKFNGM